MSIESTVGIVAGLVGSVLGILNTAHLLNSSKIKIRAYLKGSQEVGPGTIRTIKFPFSENSNSIVEACTSGRMIFTSVEVVNLSTIPIYVDEVGMKTSRSGDRSLFYVDNTLPSTQWPYRIEPKSSLLLHLTKQDVRTLPESSKYLYVDLSIEKTFHFRQRNFGKEIEKLRKITATGQVPIQGRS